MKTAKLVKLMATVGALALISAQAVAAPVNWTNWTSNAAGTIGSVNVTYSGELSGLSPGYPSWTPAATWRDGSIIDNAPPASGGMLQLLGGFGSQAVTNTITFSTPVSNPVFAIWSLGQINIPARFDFIGATPTFVSGGASAEFAGVPITVLGNSVLGSEGNGSVVFNGTFSSLSWTNPLFENYYGFTVGINAGTSVIPVPAAAWLFGSGLLGMFAAWRRKAVHSAA